MAGVLAGKVVIVTGAGGGIGAAACAVLAAAGARLIISDVVTESAAAVLGHVTRSGGEAHLISADLGSESAIQRLMTRAFDIYGRLDGAFNNAGVEHQNVPLAELSLEQWERCLRIDLTAVFLCMKYQIPALLKSGGGSIVNTSSGLGQIGTANACEYVAAKHGVIGLTRAAAVDYGAKGIRVNAILPGVISTPMISRLSTQPQMKDFFEQARQRHAMQRFGEPTEVAEAVKWLLSDASSFVTGNAFAVDGGFLAN